VSGFVHDRSDRMRMTFSGEHAKAALGGLVTNDVIALRASEGQRAAALTPKGRVIALCRVFDRGPDLLVDCDAAAGDGFAAMIRKFVNPRLAKYAVITDTTSCLGVHADDAATRIAHAVGADDAVRAALAALAPLGGRWIGEGDEALYVVRSDDLSLPGFDLIGARARVETVRASLADAGMRTATPAEILAPRLERGLPSWGAEMDLETIPQEANLDALGAISFNKGCYTGQEVVARIHFRGHVNRHLRWLVSDAPLRAGARVLDANGVDVGEVRTSVAHSARGPLAMAMVRREVEAGATVRVQDADGATDARVEPITA
jgi:folate-binding protein YgfZ